MKSESHHHTINKCIYKSTHETRLYSNYNHVCRLQALNPTSFCHLNTAVPILRLYYESANRLSRGEPCLRAGGCCVMCCASQSEAIWAGGVMEGLVRAGGVMEGLVRAGGVMEGLVRAGGVMEGLVRAGGVMEGLVRAGGVMEGLVHGTVSRIQLRAPHPHGQKYTNVIQKQSF